MKKISLVLTCLFVILASCSADKASEKMQEKSFSITPKYCYANDCYSVIRATMIQMYKDSLPNGSYVYKMTTTSSVDGGNQKIETNIISKYVNGEMVTVDMGDFVGQFNQKTQEVSGIIDKTGNLSQDEIKIFKDALRQMSGLFYSKYVSSGDIINYDIKVNLQPVPVTIKMKMFVHGLTEYEGMKYLLLETRGSGSLIYQGNNLVISLSGYTLADGTMNIAVKSIMDMTLPSGNNLKRLQVGQFVEKISP